MLVITTGLVDPWSEGTDARCGGGAEGILGGIGESDF